MTVTTLEKNREKYCLANPKDFKLKEILECGQCFRWKRQEDGSYIGVIKEGVIHIKELPEEVIFEGVVEGDFEKICCHYFDLERDYSKIKEEISKNDKNMQMAIHYGSGIRILNQNPWEMLISYIISAANNIPRISKTIETLSKKYGKEIEMGGEKFYLFPTPEELEKVTMEELRECNLGFRDKYVKKATQMVLEQTIQLNKIGSMNYENAKKYLMQIPGVGAKVADCILLFGFGKLEAFPVDTWIKKVMNELYTDSTNITKINHYATQKFGKYAGVAQQYLFYYARENNKLF